MAHSIDGDIVGSGNMLDASHSIKLIRGQCTIQLDVLKWKFPICDGRQHPVIQNDFVYAKSPIELADILGSLPLTIKDDAMYGDVYLLPSMQNGYARSNLNIRSSFAGSSIILYCKRIKICLGYLPISLGALAILLANRVISKRNRTGFAVITNEEVKRRQSGTGQCWGGMKRGRTGRTFFSAIRRHLQGFSNFQNLTKQPKFGRCCIGNNPPCHHNFVIQTFIASSALQISFCIRNASAILVRMGTRFANFLIWQDGHAETAEIGFASEDRHICKAFSARQLQAFFA